MVGILLYEHPQWVLESSFHTANTQTQKIFTSLPPFGSISFLGLHVFVKVHDLLPLAIDTSLQFIVGPAAAPGLSPSG